MSDNASHHFRRRDSHKSHWIKTANVLFTRETDWRYRTWLYYNETSRSLQRSFSMYRVSNHCAVSFTKPP
jgi:hypothetical protein